MSRTLTLRRRSFLAQVERLESRWLMAIDYLDFNGSQVPRNGDGDFYPMYYDGVEGGQFVSSINTTDAVTGNSLQLAVQNAAGSDNMLYAQFNPYGGGERGFARDYAIDAAQWQFNTYNRMSFWIKVPTNAASFETNGTSNYNLGTYVKRVSNADPSSDETGGDHYYHSINIPNGAQAGGQWIRVIINMHPNHRRGGNGNTDWGNLTNPTGEAGINYFDALTRWYFQQNNSNATLPANYLLDDIQFFQSSYPENDNQIYSVVGVYNPVNNRVIVTWQHNKNEDSIDHEVRYLTGPENQDPHAVGWSNLTAAPNGVISPPASGGYNSMAYDTTAIPGIAGAPGVWIAIKPTNSSLFSTIYVRNANYNAGPDTTPPAISNVASTNVASNSATIAWTTNEASNTQVEYGTTTSYGSSTTLNTAMVTSHSANVTGLVANTTYHYRVKSRDAAGNLQTSVDFTFTTAAPDTTAPTISSVASSNLTATGATIAWATNEASDTQVEYGTTTSYGSSTTLNTSMVTSHTANLTGLAASTTYHYRVKSRDAAGNLQTSADFTFATTATPPPTPVITGLPLSLVGNTPENGNVTVNLPSIPQGTQFIDLRITVNDPDFPNEGQLLVNGTVVAQLFGTSGTAANDGRSVAVTIRTNASLYQTGANTLRFEHLATGGYVIEAIAVEFVTAPTDVTPPTITVNPAAGSITSTGATITWTTDEASDTQVEYGTTTSYGSSTTLNTAMVTSHSANVTGLVANTTYHYRVKSRDAAGNLRTSGDFAFTTTATPDTTPPTISSVASSNLTATGATIAWATNEASDTQVEYGTTTSYGSSTALNTSMVTSHTANLTGLAASTTYHYRVKSRDAAGNLQTSADFTFTTTATPPPTPVITGLPLSLFGNTPENGNVTVNLPSIPQGTQFIDLRITVNDPDFPNEGQLRVNGTVAAQLFGTSGTSANDGRSVVVTIRTNASLYQTGANTLRFEHLATGGFAIEAMTVEFVTAPADVTPPTITVNPVAGSITRTGATITWTTNEASDTQVEYGTTTSYGSSTTLNTAMVTGHSAAITGLTPGILYHYRVKSKDAAGNLRTSGDFTFTTTANGVPVLTPITHNGTDVDTSTPGVQFYPNTTVTYAVTASDPNSDPVTVTWEYSTNGGTTWSNMGTGLTKQFTYGPSTAGITYTWRATGNDTFANSASQTLVVQIIAVPDTTPPNVSAVASSNITATGATVSWTTNEASDTQVEYGTTTSYGSSTTLNTALVTSHSANLNGLAASTIYHYRVKSRDAAGNLQTSGNFTFTTAAALDTTPPTISGVASTNVTFSSAAVVWNTNEASDTQVEYGTTTSYGSSTSLNTAMVTSHTANLTGLAASTTYHYRVKSRDAAGNLQTSSDLTFTTSAAPDTTPPTISGVASSNVTLSGATIAWTTNEASDTQVEFGTTTSYGNSTTLNTAMVTSHSTNLAGLAASTTYHYRVKSRDAAGNLQTSGDHTFTTASTGVMAVLVGDQLVVTGTSLADNIVLDQVATTVRVLSQGTPVASYASASVASASVSGGDGNDNLTIDASFGTRPVSLQGEAGDDSLVGSAGSDDLDGGSGNDNLIGHGGGDRLVGGTGSDTVDYSESPTAVSINLSSTGFSSGGDAAGDKLTNIENLIGSAAADYLYGNSDLNWMDGRDGADLIYGDGGDDNLVGGAGNDFLDGGLGIDAFDGGTGDDQIAADAADTTAASGTLKILAGGGSDFLNFSASTIGVTFNNNGPTTGGFATIYGGLGDDNITNAGSTLPLYLAGFGGNDSLTGGDANDYIDGGAGNDSLNGNDGGDTLLGGSGIDAFDGGAGADQIVADAADTTAPSGPRILGGGGFDMLNFSAETIGVTFNNNGSTTGGFEYIYGSSGNDNITNAGSTTGVFVYGFGGDDVLSGGEGNDYLDGGLGNDNLSGRDGNDTLSGGAGADAFDGGLDSDSSPDFNSGEGDSTTNIP